MKKNLDFKTVLKRARWRREKIPQKIAAGAAVVLLFLGIFTVMIFRNRGFLKTDASFPSQEESLPEESILSLEETVPETTEDTSYIDEVIESYPHMGLVRVDGYLNMRKEPAAGSDVIGKLLDGSAFSVLADAGDGWLQVSSGGLEGYVHSDFCILGEEAVEAARPLVKKRAIILADRLNVRKEPSTDGEIVGSVYANERYEALSEQEGWIQIGSGFVSSEFVEVRYGLNEARKLDLKSMVFNLYENLGISNVSNYLNIREEPKEDGKIIGKMPSKAAGDILESLDGWYKIRSGPITGYVKADYILTGGAAKDEALKEAQLMAIVSTEVLNVRKEPNTDSTIWTQITNSERYPVVSQQDGWAEIELEDNNNAFIATEFADVRYALNEAIKFSPLEEQANRAASRRAQIVNYALQFLGNPYVWGGTSLTKGCDCSGFTMKVLGNYGISLPHYSVSQSQLGTKVSSGNMRPGDLIFYANSRGTINHVSMYIGNGQVVHAASRRSGIKISAWNYRKPVTIRNVIGE